MIALLITVGALIYIGCGVLTYGLIVGYYQRHFWDVRDHKDASLARQLSLFGPLSLLIVFVYCEFGYHGLLYSTTVSRWMKERIPDLKERQPTIDHVRRPDKMGEA